MSKENDYVVKLRNAFKVYMLLVIDHDISEGRYDPSIKAFLDADALEINIKLELVPNDILIMRALAEGGITQKLLSKVRNLWREVKNE